MEIRCGSEAKGDCLVVADSDAGPKIDVSTKGEQLLEAGLRAVVEETLEALDATGLSLEITDRGALDYVITARIETAVRSACPKTAPIEPTVERPRSERDRPRRSRLYTPGSNPRLLAGVDVFGADCVLLDLEDSVPPQEKVAARILVKHLLAAVPFAEEVWVRINPLESCGLEDLAEVLRGHPHGICLPKAECEGDVAQLAAELDRLEKEFGRPVGSTWIMSIIETARGVLGAAEVAAADPRVVIVAFGAEDYMRDIGAVRTSAALAYARAKIVAAAAAARAQSSDTVYADAANMAGLIEEANQARELGFDGKGAINPRQIAPIHRAFSPAKDELSQAQAIVAAADAAEKQGLGAVAIDGKMVDKPVLDRARRVLKYAEKLARGGGRDA